MASEPDLASLLTRVGQADRAAFARLYQEASSKLFGVAVRMLHRRDLAEEALQDAFLKIWQRAGDFDPKRGAALTWMVSIVRNRALDLMRRKREELIEDDPNFPEMPDTMPNALDLAAESSELRRLLMCLEQLEPKQRECILLAYYKGFTHEEMAARLGSPLGTVKSWVRRGLLAVRRCVEA
jgi:RNA polymerase sigma-70 factor (ECF subfamily)